MIWFGGDAVGERRLDRVARDGSDDQIRESRLDRHKQRQDRDSERIDVYA